MSEALSLEDLGLGGLRVGRGRRGAPPPVMGTRPLTEEDFIAAATKPAEALPSVKTLRHQHHQLAKLLATGTRPTDAAIITGFSISRISVLKADPSFAELLAYYSQMEEEGWKEARADMRERLVGVGFDSIEMLQQRLDEEPESFSNDALMKLLELTTDRTGHGKVTKLEGKVTHALDDATLARIRSGGEGPPSERQLSPEDRGALISLVRSSTGVYSQAEEVDGCGAGGTGLREEGGEGAASEAGD